MGVLLTTTGLIGSVTINDFGGRVFTHPTINEEISEEYEYSEIRESVGLGAALDAGYISLTNNGDIVGNSTTLNSVLPVSFTGGAGTLGTKFHLINGDNIVIEENYEYFLNRNFILDSGSSITINTGAELSVNKGNIINNGSIVNNGSIENF